MTQTQKNNISAVRKVRLLLFKTAASNNFYFLCSPAAYHLSLYCVLLLMTHFNKLFLNICHFDIFLEIKVV